jgi:hypothetical protein
MLSRHRRRKARPTFGVMSDGTPIITDADRERFEELVRKGLLSVTTAPAKRRQHVKELMDDADPIEVDI